MPDPAARANGSSATATRAARTSTTVVDWIERIPFAETRAYVQRVMENYQVYKMRLSGNFDIEGDLVKGRRRTAAEF